MGQDNNKKECLEMREKELFPHHKAVNFQVQVIWDKT